MNENFMKFLKSLKGIGTKGNYNPSLQVTQASGAATAAPWWARAAFAGRRQQVMKEGLLGKMPASYGTTPEYLKQKALEKKFSTFDKDALPGSFTDDRTRVAQKIAKAAQNWKIPGLGQPKPASKIDKFKDQFGGGKEANLIQKIVDRDKRFQEEQRLAAERKAASLKAASQRKGGQKASPRPLR